MNVFEHTHLKAKIGDEDLFSTMESAIDVIHAKAHPPGEGQDCPLLTVCRLADVEN
jgi:hypothetical protein